MNSWKYDRIYGNMTFEQQSGVKARTGNNSEIWEPQIIHNVFMVDTTVIKGVIIKVHLNTE